MKNLIKGIHHVAMKCTSDAEFEKVKAFYGEILGLPVKREWEAGVMFDTGSGIIEIFRFADDKLGTGVLRHFAFAVDSANDCANAVKAAGYEVFMGPKDVEIPSKPPYPIRVAFCRGPLGEEIEFFEER